jgi:cytochrome c-type biogenesis protein
VTQTFVAPTRDIAAGHRGTGARNVVAWAAVVLILGVAVLGALQSDSGGLAVAVSTIAGGATDALQAAARLLPLGYPFAVGMASAVNPCGCALLPTYLGLYLGTATEDKRSWTAQLKRALLVSAAMTGSFVLLFGAAGIVLSAAGAVVGPLLPWLSIGVGVVLVLAGGRLLAGGSLTAQPAERLADAVGSSAVQIGPRGYAAYGLAFALSSLGCTLPLFLTVVGTGLSQSQNGFAVTIQELLLYALGMGSVVFVLTVLVAVMGRGVLAHVRGVGRVLQPLSAVLLLATGGYIVYYWLSAGGILG